METAFHAALDRAAIHELASDVQVVPSELGPDGRLIGGLALVLREPVGDVPPAGAGAIPSAQPAGS